MIDADTLETVAQLAPDIMETLMQRALVLERIAALEPIGRRALAVRLNLPEREVRSISTLLRNEGHIRLTASGMEVTQQGIGLLEDARQISHGSRAISMQEAALARLLGVARVVIVRGDVDQDSRVLSEIGKQGALHIRSLVRDGVIIALTGGSTMAQVVQHLPDAAPLDVTVLPARGGRGRAVEMQASTLAARVANKLGGHYHLLHVPDQISASARAELLKNPEIQEIVDMLARTDVLLHGIGRADEIALYRRMDRNATLDLVERGAVAEAFGHYFDVGGRIVDSTGGLGIATEAIGGIRVMAAFAAGRSKAQAIIAVMRACPHELLVTDEGAARQMIALLNAANA